MTASGEDPSGPLSSERLEALADAYLAFSRWESVRREAGVGVGPEAVSDEGMDASEDDHWRANDLLSFHESQGLALWRILSTRPLSAEERGRIGETSLQAWLRRFGGDHAAEVRALAEENPTFRDMLSVVILDHRNGSPIADLVFAVSRDDDPRATARSRRRDKIARARRRN